MHLLIPTTRWKMLSNITTLHSTMYLLILLCKYSHQFPDFPLHSTMYLLIHVFQLSLYHLPLFSSFCRPPLIHTHYIYIFYRSFAHILYLCHCRPPYIFTPSSVDILSAFLYFTIIYFLFLIVIDTYHQNLIAILSYFFSIFPFFYLLNCTVRIFIFNSIIIIGTCLSFLGVTSSPTYRGGDFPTSASLVLVR